MGAVAEAAYEKCISGAGQEMLVCDRKIYGRNNGRYYGRKAYGRNVSAIILFRSHRSFKMSYIEAKSIKIWLNY